MTDINKINPGIDTSFSTKLNANLATSLRQTGLTQVQQLQDRAVTPSADGGQFVEAYIDADGRNNSVTVVNTSAVFDTDKYKANTSATEPFIIIEATSISSASDFAINDCQIVKVATGKWQLTCDTGTDEVKRAQLYKTLFYGTSGANARASATYITGISALKTNITRDVGKQAHYASVSTGDNAANNGTYTGTFVNTSTNSDCSSWSKVREGTDSSMSDEYGTDLTADEQDNPATCQLDIDTHNFIRWEMPSGSTLNNKSAGASNGYTGNALVICTGDITWVENTTGGTVTYSNTDFFTDNSIPLFTATTETLVVVVEHAITTGTFGTTLASAFMTFKAEDWESGADVQYKLLSVDPADINQNSYVQIEATSLEVAKFEINDCVILEKSTGVWILGSITTDGEVARARIYKTLFYGNDGSDPLITSSYITGLTAIKTSVTADIGRQFHYANVERLTDGALDTRTFTGTFANTTTNEVSAWSYVSNTQTADVSRFELPEATTVNTQTGSGTSDETEADTSGDDATNPADCQLSIQNDSNVAIDSKARVLIACFGDITWVASASFTTEVETDFTTDNSIPVLGTAAALHSTYDDSGFLATNEIASFTAFTNTPYTCVVKLIPKTTSPTAGYPSINGVALYGDRP